MSYSSAIIIEELTSNGQDAKRVVRLLGAALPFMGAAWKGANQLITTWYPGNGDEATQQNMGPRDLPSSWNGEWRRTMLGSTDSGAWVTGAEGVNGQIVHPDTIALLLEDIFRTGRRLRVTWEVITGDGSPIGISAGSEVINRKIVREGRAKDWDFSFVRMQDITWTITFEWVGRGVRTARVTQTRGDSMLKHSFDLQSKIQAIKNLQARALAAKNKPGALTLGQLEALANYPSQLTNRIGRQLQQITSSVSQLGDIALKLRSQPIQIANQAIDLAHNSVSLVNNFTDTLGRAPPELLSNRLKVDSFLRATRRFGEMHDATRDVARAATDFASQIRPSSVAGANTADASRRTAGQPGTVIASYVTKDGDTPQKISQKFYKTPDHAVDILRANKLSWYQATFKKGAILVIPALVSTTTGV